MFETVEELSEKLSETGYFIDPTMTKVVFLAVRIQKPLLLEGPAGSGKTLKMTSPADSSGPACLPLIRAVSSSRQTAQSNFVVKSPRECFVFCL
jgi:hypothetical protein